MQILRNVQDIEKNVNSSITIGTFDGLHKAHQAIIKKTIEVAGKSSGRSVLVTFDPHPRTVLDGVDSPKLLIETDEKIDLIRKLGLSVDYLLIMNFTKEFSKMSSLDFFKEIIFDKIGVSNLIIGYDHNFGNGRTGNAEFLKSLRSRYDFDLHIVDKIVLNDEQVNSTHIRKLLLAGEIQRANALLGWNFTLTGKIIEGSMRGRNIGFPTANLKPGDPNKLVPKNGVYLVKAHFEGITKNGFLNIGSRPTFENSTEVFIETHIFDFNGDVYGKTMTLEFLQFLRDEKKFNSVNELIDQINQDKEICLRILNNKNI
jgi:riboflavin kinase / FMN adenylyltransferase